MLLEARGGTAAAPVRPAPAAAAARRGRGRLGSRQPQISSYEEDGPLPPAATAAAAQALQAARGVADRNARLAARTKSTQSVSVGVDGIFLMYDIHSFDV